MITSLTRRGTVLDFGHNLFRINATEQNPSDTAQANTTKRIFTPYTYAKGTAWSNSFSPAQVSAYSVNNGVISIKSNNGYGVGFAFPAEAGSTYSFTAKTTGYAEAYVTFYKQDGTAVTYSPIILNKTFVVPADIVTMVITLNNDYRHGNTDITYTNVRLAKIG